MKHRQLMKRRLMLRPVLINILIGCFTVLSVLTASGQNVTISPSSGSLIAGVTASGEVGFENGSSSLWRHNQLPLTLHVSDYGTLTESGVLKEPAGDIRLDDVLNQNLYLIHGGSTVTTHLNISLPKGYRFTGYRMVLLNNMNGRTVAGQYRTGMNKRMYETNSSFEYNNALASTPMMGSTNSNQEFVIERTSKTTTDMGNNLYFYFWRQYDKFYACTIKSIELYFTAEAEFQAEGVPGTPSEIISEGVNMVGSSFTTGKLDLGTIQPNTKSGETYYSYNYLNVIDLTAQNWLYQKDAVTAGKLPATAGRGNIQVLRNDGKLYYALGNGTYYIETPTETKNQNGKTIPLGYRITGAQINAHYGTQANASTITYDGKTGTISYTTGYVWQTTYYLQTDGTWDTSRVQWTLTKTNKLQSGQYYLAVQKYTQNGRDSYIANGTTDINAASAFTISNNQVKYGDLYLSRYNNDRARFYSDDDTANTGSATNPAYTPSPFTLTLYGTSASTPKETANVSSSSTNATLSVSGLNNDAVKFTISGLDEGAKALITYNLTMEQLNPFINTLDIVCHSKKIDGATITQQFTSNDFQVAGGAFHFYVPTEFADENNNCQFTFENLTSKYMDSTYGHGTNGNSRNYFVKSEYYNTYGDGKQYQTSGNELATTKVSTTMCGDQPFKYNNAHELANDNVSATAATLEEYPYSEALYTAADGSGTNIAPTTAMEHRYYAFYLMEIDLKVKEYDAYCKLTQLYDATYYGDGQDKAMYGGSFEAYEKGHAGETGYQIPSEQAFLTLAMMKKALNDAKAEKNIGLDQILYLDHTELYSVLLDNMESMASLKAELNPNCLIFFPERSVYSADNFVSKTMSGDFRACKNIVITDKQPFYSPYKITVPAENYASYSRKITNPMNGKATLATLVLPFSIELSDGVHSNDDCSFTLRQMVASNCLSTDSETGSEGKDFWGTAHFEPVTEARTTPNRPYMVEVNQASSDENTSFEILQYGSDVYATPGDMNADYTFSGETATGSINFTNYGSYSGKKLPKNDGWYYFAQGKFYNSKNLSAKYDNVYMQPFRAYFDYDVSGGSAKDMAGFEVSFDEPTSINATPVVSNNGLNIETGKGYLTITASRETNVSIVSASGVLVWRAQVENGQQETVALPSGLYIVNGKKVIIR